MNQVFRFAPSPTGYLHIGGARTALFNWLMARKTGGRFRLRIEDTDRARGSEEMVRGILDGLSWLGLDHDGELVFQGANAGKHVEAARRLVDSGHAYPCFCSREEQEERRRLARLDQAEWRYEKTCLGLEPGERRELLQAGRPHVIRFNVDREAEVAWTDLVYGPQEVRCREIEDFVLLRSDGSPLYNLSVVCDDHEMGVTTVLRGQDHLSNTPKQILLYQALGWPVPGFGHLPLIMAPGKKKLSKRSHGEVVSLGTYRDRGFVPEAFRNFLALLGWNPGDDRELFGERELVELFDPGRINRANAVFNFSEHNPKEWTDKKALHINSEYIKRLPGERLFELALPFLERAGCLTRDWALRHRDLVLPVLEAYRSRMFTLQNYADYVQAYFADEFPYDPKPLKKNLLRHVELRERLPELAESFAACEEWTLESTESCLRGYAAEQGLKDGLLINSCRVVLTGQGVGPGIFDVLLLLGRPKVVERLRAVPRFFEAESQGAG